MVRNLKVVKLGPGYTKIVNKLKIHYLKSKYVYAFGFVNIKLQINRPTFYKPGY